MENEEGEVVEIDEENHPATQNLRELLDSGQISAETYNNLCFKFKKLHQAFTQSCSTEQSLLRRTRDLNKELKAQKLTIQNSATQQQEHRNALTMLRQYVTNIQAELDSTNDQTNSTKANTEIKQKEAEKLRIKVETATEDQRIKLEPQKRQIQQENEELEKAIAEKRKTIDDLNKYFQDMADRITKAEETLADYEKRKRAENQKMLDIGSNPIKLRQKANAAESLHNSLLSEEKQVNQQLQTLENQYKTLELSTHDLETEFMQIGNDIDGMLGALSDMKYKASDYEAKCDELKQIKLVRDNEKKRLLKQIDEKNAEQGALLSKQDTVSKDIAKKEKEATKLEEAIARVIADKRSLQGALKTAMQDKDLESENKVKYEQDYAKTMAEKERVLQALAASESLSAQLIEEIKSAMQERDRKQLIHDQLSAKEMEFLQQMAEASLIRDRKAREMAVMKKKTFDARVLAKERNLDYLDLARKQEMIMQNMADTSKLYEQVKLERNRHVNTIQTSRQLIVELKEKIRILESETEVLRKEFETKDAQVRVQKNELTQAFSRRDSTKGDLKKAENLYQDLEAKIDFQANETDRLDTVLRNLEVNITTHQGRYSNHADDCADRRRMLIDKQDELCMLYEQFNRHEEVMKRGEIELQKREEEIKSLELSLRDFKRQIDLMQRKVPQVTAYNKEIQELKKQIEKEKKDVDDITRKLEVPGEQERKRSYCGRDFTLKELEDKVSKYEQRINSKEQQLWEKKILLREIQDKIKGIEDETSRGSGKANKIMARSGKMRADSMALNRKKLAALSEMAVYKAQKMALEEEKNDIKIELDAAMSRTERGDAFDEYSHRMVKMHERDIMTASMTRGHRFDPLDDDEDEFVKPGREHFDAYPTKDGLSRPYGAFPVFQPAKPSAQLRHYRKETERPIEL